MTSIERAPHPPSTRLLAWIRGFQNTFKVRFKRLNYRGKAAALPPSTGTTAPVVAAAVAR
jgi:hypothetical protein